MKPTPIDRPAVLEAAAVEPVTRKGSGFDGQAEIHGILSDMSFGRHDEHVAQALDDLNEAVLEGVKALREIAHLLRVRLNPPIGAVNSQITVTGDPMQATQNFTDANGLPTTAPAGLVEAWASDNDAVDTIDATSGAITVVADGTANISVANTGAFLPDGVTPFPDPAPFALVIAAGAAVASTISVS